MRATSSVHSILYWCLSFQVGEFCFGLLSMYVGGRPLASVPAFTSCIERCFERMVRRIGLFDHAKG